jgi:hypothetical protein
MEHHDSDIPKSHPIVTRILHSFVVKHLNRALYSFTEEELWEIENTATERIEKLGGVHEALISLEYADGLPIKSDYKILTTRFDRTKVQVSRAILDTVELHIWYMYLDILDRLEKKGKKVNLKRLMAREVKNIERKIKWQNRRFPYPKIEENY